MTLSMYIFVAHWEWIVPITIWCIVCVFASPDRCCLPQLFFDMIIYMASMSDNWWCVWFDLDWIVVSMFMFGSIESWIVSVCVFIRLCLLVFSNCVWFNWGWIVVFVIVIGSIKGGWCMAWSRIDLTSHPNLNTNMLLVNDLHANGFCHFDNLWSKITPLPYLMLCHNIITHYESSKMINFVGYCGFLLTCDSSE